MSKIKIKSKIQKNNNSKKIFTYDLYNKKDKSIIGKLIFKDDNENCDLDCNLEKEEYYKDVFFEIFLNIIYKLFKRGYKTIRIIPKNQIELETLISFGFILQKNDHYLLENRDKYKTKINNSNHDEFQSLYTSLSNNEKILKMKEIPQHRGSNSYEHSLKVAKLAYKISRTLKIKADYYSIIRASILHDYFLYDWRTQPEKKHGHGRNHPYIAMENADKDFKLNYLEKLIIIQHMWPINFLNYPKSYESKIVSISDKIISTFEALTSKKFKAHFREKTLKKLKNL